MATAAHHDDDFHTNNNNELPPPAYELTHAELDRKIADAAQRSLAISEQQNNIRPNLPPIDEDGFPAWDDSLFEFNRQQREREAEEARNSKAQSEYNRPSANHSYTAPASSSASSSSSPPPSHAQSLNLARRSLPPVAPAHGRVRSPNPDKQKQEQFGWLNNNPGVIARDEDPHPPMTATQNVGRPPSGRPGVPLQVQVGPRPHDVLAQPQSPVSDPEDDNFPGSGGASLARAPTYHPRGQAHPGHARVVNERQQQQQQGPRRSMESESLSRNGSIDLPPFTAVAPSLEGPAYEEVMRTTTPANNRRVTSPAPPPPVPANETRRQSGMEWKPMAARPQAQERVAGARQSTMSAPVRQATVAPPPVQQPWVNSPSSYGSSPVTPAVVARPNLPPAPASVPAVPMVAPRLGTFDPGVAYRSTQAYTLAGRTDSVAGNGMADAQKALHESGANAFYNAAVASTLTKAPVFRAPPPPPPRATYGSGVDDDVASVLSGRSGGGRQGSVYSGGVGHRASTYGPPAGGIMSGGAPLPVPPLPGMAGSRTNYVPVSGAYQPGLGTQVPGAGGYQPNVAQQGGGVYQPKPAPGGYQSPPGGGYQAQWATPPSGMQQQQPQSPQSPGYQAQQAGTYQPQQAGAYQPYPQQQAYQTQPTGTYQPQPTGGYQPAGGLFAAGAGTGTGGYMPAQPAAGFAPPPPPPGQFTAPPPPPAAPGKKMGKLYKRL